MLKLLPFRRSAITLAKRNRAASQSKARSDERANVHKNVHDVAGTLNRRLLFRRGIDEPTESFPINHHTEAEEERG